MTNLEAVISILAAHREARRWSDDAVAVDLLARLGLDAGAEHGLADPHPAEAEPAQDSVGAAEAVAKEAADRAAAYRAALTAALTPTHAEESTPEPTPTPPDTEAPERLAPAPEHVGDAVPPQ